MWCKHNVVRTESDFADEIAWGAQHGWRAERLDAIEAELAHMKREPKPSGARHPGGDRSAASLDRRDRQMTPRWEQRLAEIAAPRLPEAGDGIDIGL